MFETLTVPRPPESRIAGPAAIVIHGAVIAAIFLLTAWRVGEIGAPPISIVFPATTAPRPSAGSLSSGGSAPARLGHGTPAARPATVQPVSIGPTPTATTATPLDPETSPAAPDFSNRTAGGPGEPDEVGSPGDDFNSPLPANAPNVAAPRLLSQLQPEYPEISRRMKEQGVVVLKAVIGLDGRVEDVRILRGATELLDAAAIRAVGEWRYAPATMNGRAIRVFLTATVRFTLH